MMDTLIETVRLRNGAAPLWYLHVRRLATSCRALGVPIPVDLPTPEGGSDRVHRLLVSRRGVVAGERPVGSTAPVRLVTSKVVHRPYPHKLVDRERFDRALAEAKAGGADDGLLLTVGGQVAETAIWGVFWWEDGRVAAPALDIGILPGVGRARIVEVVGEIIERKATLEELRGKALFVANSVRGVVPVASLDGATVPESDETEALAGRFWP
jgi:4-amino-4-deoxychorismate lyase